MDTYINDVSDWQVVCNNEATICSPKTLKNSWLLVASVLKEATGNPPKKVLLPQIVPNEKPFLEPEQIKIFISAIKGKPCEIPALLALSSLRRSEICALTWDKVDLKKRQILVSGAAVFGVDNKLTHKKTNKNQFSRRYVPIMMNELYSALDNSECKTGLIVNCNPNTIYAQINRVCKGNGLPLVGVHGLRHSFASLAYHLQIPEMVAMQIGGWSNLDTMRNIYTHLAQSDISKYETKMTEFFNNTNISGYR